MIPDRLQYFLEHFWIDKHFHQIWTLGARIYYQNTSTNTRKLWGHPGNILFVISQLSGNPTKMTLRFETQIWDSDFEFFETQICKENIVPGWFHILSNIFWGILVPPKINKVGFEALRHVKTLRNHEIWSFRPLR